MHLITIQVSRHVEVAVVVTIECKLFFGRKLFLIVMGFSYLYCKFIFRRKNKSYVFHSNMVVVFLMLSKR